MSNIHLFVLSPRPLHPALCPSVCFAYAPYAAITGPSPPTLVFRLPLTIASMKFGHPALESHIIVCIVGCVVR